MINIQSEGWVGGAILEPKPRKAGDDHFQGFSGCSAFSAAATAAKEKAMAPHFSTLAWKIPWVEEPGRLQSMGLLFLCYSANL